MAIWRVAVFIDWQNAYRAAREAFGLERAPPARGNFDPIAVAFALAAGNLRGRRGKLVKIEIHRGMPSPSLNPKGHGAAQRQANEWVLAGPGLVSVKLRPLRVNPETGVEEQKGIDVALASSAVGHVLSKQCDVAIIFSHDSDLLPAVETICRLKGPECVETASWASDSYRRRIPPAKPKRYLAKSFGVVNHTLRAEVFDRVETPIDFARA